LERSRAALGLFASTTQAEEALDLLLSEGFSSSDIFAVMPDTPTLRLARGTLGLLEGLGSLDFPDAPPLLAAGAARRKLERLTAMRLNQALESFGLTVTAAHEVAAGLTSGSVLLGVFDVKLDASIAEAVYARCGADPMLATISNPGDLSEDRPTPSRDSSGSGFSQPEKGGANI